MESDQANYEAKYTELQLLGRGNYGSAFVAKSNVSGKLFVAKKMNLDGLTQKEIQSTQGEIDILKKFSDVNQYPFIVKYIESFSFDRNLIIIMEFCQYGDLSGFIRNAKRKGQLLEEDVIVSWLLMLLMGIQALHSKNVLHRDLKSANVFLTSNKFIKIGDFGISKILDSTSAKTFVGTPYYLSPEICSNKPYEFSSDVWALGCILYELCTLNYPFQANNILNLALKITSEEVAPIPKKYSKQLNNIVMGLLNKDQKKRISLDEIMKTPYMKKFMGQNGHNIDKICEKIPLKRTVKVENLPSEEATQQLTLKEKQSAEDTMKTIKSNFEKTNNDSFNLSKTDDSLEFSMTNMSPAQKAKERKLQQADRKANELKNAIKENSEHRKFAMTKKKQQFGGYGSSASTSAAKKLQTKYLNENKEKFEQTRRQKRGLNAGQSIDLEYISTMTQKMRDMGVTSNHDERMVPALEKTLEKNPQYKVYTEGIEEADEYEDDFEEYVPEEIEEEKDEIEAVTTFVSVVSGNAGNMSPTKRAKVEKAFEKSEIVPTSNKQRKEEAIKKCVYMVGQERYQLLYELVTKCYVNGIFRQTKEIAALRKIGSASEKQVLQLIDEIKFYEEN